MIKDAGGDAIFVKTDVTDMDQVKALVDKAVETYGRLDCAHNNAGIEGVGGSCTECTDAASFVTGINMPVDGGYVAQ